MARQMVENVANSLHPGGLWIGTLPDAYWIVRKLKSIEGLEFGNSVYNIRFDQKDTYPTYGHRYVFHLEDAIEDCPEFLVHFPTLEKLAKEQGLDLMFRRSFHQYYEESTQNNTDARDLLGRMKVIGGRDPRLSNEEWEVAGVYMVFVFKKSETVSSTNRDGKKTIDNQ